MCHPTVSLGCWQHLLRQNLPLVSAGHQINGTSSLWIQRQRGGGHGYLIPKNLPLLFFLQPVRAQPVPHGESFVPPGPQNHLLPLPPSSLQAPDPGAAVPHGHGGGSWAAGPRQPPLWHRGREQPRALCGAALGPAHRGAAASAEPAGAPHHPRGRGHG